MDRKTRCAQGPPDRQEIGRPLAPAIVAASTFDFDSQAEVDRHYETGHGFV